MGPAALRLPTTRTGFEMSLAAWAAGKFGVHFFVPFLYTKSRGMHSGTNLLSPLFLGTLISQIIIKLIAVVLCRRGQK